LALIEEALEKFKEEFPTYDEETSLNNRTSNFKNLELQHFGQGVYASRND